MKNKNKRYVYSLSPETGKIRRMKRDVIQRQEFTNENPDTGVVVRPASCPYGIEEPRVLEDLTKPIRTSRLSCTLDIELSLSAAFDKHEHAIVTDIDRSKFPEGTDFSKWEFDQGSLLCGLFFEISPKITATISELNLQEDTETIKSIKRARKKAVRSSKDLQYFDEEKESEKRFTNYVSLLNKTEKHLMRHLRNELKRVAERLAFEVHTLDDRGGDRENSLKIFLEEEESELRKRLPTVKGRVPNKERTDFGRMKIEFQERAFGILTKLESTGARLNKNQLAKNMFRSDNPLLLLNRKLKEFDLTFEQILNQYIEQKSP